MPYELTSPVNPVGILPSRPSINPSTLAMGSYASRPARRCEQVGVGEEFGGGPIIARLVSRKQ